MNEGAVSPKCEIMSGMLNPDLVDFLFMESIKVGFFLFSHTNHVKLCRKGRRLEARIFLNCHKMLILMQNLEKKNFLMLGCARIHIAEVFFLLY